MPANTIAKSDASAPRRRAFAAISTAMRSCGSPPPEKIGNFCPRTSEFSRSTAVTPVSMNDRGVARDTGFSGTPSIRRRFSTASGGPLSIGCPMPLNTRPSTPGPTPKSIGSPRKRTTVPASPRPAVGSSISIVTMPSSIAATRPRRGAPSRPLTTTASFSPTSSVRRMNSNGPSSRMAASCTVTLGCMCVVPRRRRHACDDQRRERVLDLLLQSGEPLEFVFADFLAHARQRSQHLERGDLLRSDAFGGGALGQFDEVDQQSHHAGLAIGSAVAIDRRERRLAQEGLVDEFGGEQRQALAGRQRVLADDAGHAFEPRLVVEQRQEAAPQFEPLVLARGGARPRGRHGGVALQ